MKYYLAIDIGASSGRHIVGWMEDGQLKTQEVYRFPNGMVRQDDHLIWDIEALLGHVRTGIDKAKEQYPVIESLSIDTWGVDYVLLKGDEEVLPCYAYRDSRTDASIPEVHKILPYETLYEKTGIQFQSFNTIYQLYADKMAGRLEGVTDFLMMPEYLLYKLCGGKGHEYTNASTGGMVNAATREYDPSIIEALGLPKYLFHKLDQPGTFLGMYEGIRCLLCATHDTGSAVEGIPMKDDQLFLSSGTWSLLGVKSLTPLTGKECAKKNWSNEGGVGYIRFLKNIMGMWVVNELKKELAPELSFPEIVKLAEESTYDETTDVNASDFMAPESMKGAFDSVLAVKAKTVGDYFRCAYRSLALCYKNAIEELKTITGKEYEELYIVGGGAKNAFLNKLTEDFCQIRVVALPIEATALGNLKVQIEAAKEQ